MTDFTHDRTGYTNHGCRCDRVSSLPDADVPHGLSGYGAKP